MTAGAVDGEILRSAKLQDHNSFDQPDTIRPSRFNGFKRTGNLIEVELPPFSVVVLAVRR